MKIVVIHQYFLMPGFPGGSRFNEFARMWSEAGHDVTVIAGTVDYNSGTAPERYRGRWLTEEQEGRVKVWRCHVPGTYGKGYLGRAWAFFGFTFSAASAALLERDGDVVIATSPPLITPLPGWIAARLRLGKPAKLIFEIRDLWPESAVTTGVLKEGALLTRLLYGLERWACTTADRVNVLTPAFRDDLVDRGLAVAGKIAFVPNGADVEAFQPGSRDNDVREKHGWGDRFVVLYAGAHGRANAVGQLVEAAELLRDRKDILIATVGDGPERAKVLEEAKRRGLTNIQLLGAVPKERMPAYVRACDVGAAVLQDNPTFRTVYPNKVFDYMACAKPSLLAIDGVARQLVCDQAQAGLFAAPEKPQALADAIRRFADMAPGEREAMGERGRSWVHANATRDSLAARYLEVMQGNEKFGQPQHGLRLSLKKGFDRAMGTVGLVAAAPVIGASAFAVWRSLGRPVFFTQERPGREGKPFRIVKLRTMSDARDAAGNLLPDEARLGRMGQFMRRWSLDELPQLLNVARGELSLVGPRPLLMRYLGRYSPDQARRHEVEPGITGWAQIHGRNALKWSEKFALDTWYVDHWSLGLDAKILLKTIARVVVPSGISQGGHATMPEFMGNDAA